MAEQRTCCVCHRQPLEPTERQCCVACLARTRNALAETVELYALLPGELTGHVGAARPPDAVGRPDSDGLPEAMVMLAGGTAGTVIGTKPTASDPTGRAHAADVWPSDPPSVLASLAFWEDDWRSVAGLGAATVEATVAGCSEFLLDRLGWAAQQHPAFDEFAGDMHQLVAKLQYVTRSGDQVDRGAKIPCPECGRPLIRHYANPDVCEHIRPQREHRPECAKVLDRKTRRMKCGHNLDDPDHWPGGWEPWRYYARRLEAWEEWHSHHDQGGRRDDWRCSSQACGRLVTEREYWFAVAAYEQQMATTA